MKGNPSTRTPAWMERVACGVANVFSSLDILVMIIPDQLLKKYGASVVPLAKDDVLFREGDHARSFFIVRTGKIRMVNYNEDGREFVQGLFFSGESFGEPPFFTDGVYPASAEALEPGEVWKVPKTEFFELLRNNFEIQIELMRVLCTRLIYKATMLSEIAIEEAEHRILTLLQYLAASSRASGEEEVKMPFTRQQIADMTGLRVETVIRTVKSLEQKGELSIDSDGKILWTNR